MKSFVLTLMSIFIYSSLIAQNSTETYFNHLSHSNAIPLIHSVDSDFDATQLSNVSIPENRLYTNSSYSENRILLRSNNRFEVWGLISEDAAADTVIQVLTNNYGRVSDSLNTTFSHKIIVDIYPDLASYHAAIGWPNAPDWVVGNATGDDKIDMVSPYNPGPAHTFASIINVVTHEMVHNFVAYMTPGFNVPIWINEGAATFLANQIATTYAVCTYVTQNNHQIPTLNDLNSGSVTFGNLGGYTFSYTIVEFIVTQQGGAGALSSLITSGMNYSLVGFTSEQSFETAWNHFLYVNYPCASYGGLQASFAADVTEGDGPLTVHFTDFSAQYGTPITSWDWDFDNDGVIDSHLENPSYTYNNMGTYTVTLTVSDGSTSSSYSRTNYIHVLTNGGVGVYEENRIDVLMYPNPTSDILNIEWIGDFSYSIWNLQGQMLFGNGAQNKVAVDLRDLQKGVYLVLVESTSGSSIQRVLVK